MKKFVFTTWMMTSIASLLAQSAEIPLWDGPAPGNKGVSVEEINENYRISKVTTPLLYHFPVTGGENKPAIVIIPGGGYVREAFDHEGLMVAAWFNRLGVEAFVLKYRLPDEELVENATYVPLMDAQQAIYIVRSNAAKWGVDPDRIGVIGFSAGGHLASCVSTLFSNPVKKELKSSDVRPDFSVLMYPVISMEDQYTHKGSKENLLGVHPDSALIAYFSTENQVSQKTPVTLLVHAMDDGAVPVANSDRYASNLFKRGGEVTKLILPKGGHGFGFDPKRPVAFWTQYLEVWLNTYVLKK